MKEPGSGSFSQRGRDLVLFLRVVFRGGLAGDPGTGRAVAGRRDQSGYLWGGRTFPGLVGGAEGLEPCLPASPLGKKDRDDPIGLRVCAVGQGGIGQGVAGDREPISDFAMLFYIHPDGPAGMKSGEHVET